MATKSKITKLEVGQKYTSPLDYKSYIIKALLEDIVCVDYGGLQHVLNWYRLEDCIEILNDGEYTLDGNS